MFSTPRARVLNKSAISDGSNTRGLRIIYIYTTCIPPTTTRKCIITHTHQINRTNIHKLIIQSNYSSGSVNHRNNVNARLLFMNNTYGYSYSVCRDTRKLYIYYELIVYYKNRCFYVHALEH